MVSISEIERFYPDNQRPFKRNLLREYLQHKILQIIFESEYSLKLSFIGGTCLRIVFGTNRFSKDLDFDNFGITSEEFDRLADLIAAGLRLEGYLAEIRTVSRGAFYCYIRIPELLFNNNLSGFREEKILIQLHTEFQNYRYDSVPFLLNRFDILSRIFHTPVNILLSQKLRAILNRKTPKGRDYYDVMFLWSLTKPDYMYLEEKEGINNPAALKKRLLDKVIETDLQGLIRDVSPFLINQSDAKRIELFPEFVKSIF